MNKFKHLVTTDPKKFAEQADALELATAWVNSATEPRIPDSATANAEEPP
jgi:hypothetical protein